MQRLHLQVIRYYLYYAKKGKCKQLNENSTMKHLIYLYFETFVMGLAIVVLIQWLMLYCHCYLEKLGCVPHCLIGEITSKHKR